MRLMQGNFRVDGHTLLTRITSCFWFSISSSLIFSSTCFWLFSASNCALLLTCSSKSAFNFSICNWVKVSTIKWLECVESCIISLHEIKARAEINDNSVRKSISWNQSRMLKVNWTTFVRNYLIFNEMLIEKRVLFFFFLCNFKEVAKYTLIW